MTDDASKLPAWPEALCSWDDERSVDPDVEGSEALYAASNDAEEVLAAEGER